MNLMKKQIPSYPLRMPSDIKELLKSVAKENGRSLHSEIMLRLYASTDLSPPLSNSVSEIEEIAERVARRIFKEEINRK